MIEVRANQEMRAFRRCINMLTSKRMDSKESLVRMVHEVTRRLAATTKDLVTKTYMEGAGAASHSPGTILTYQAGKATGAARAHRMRFPQARPGVRSGTLAKNVVVNPIGKARGYRVEIDPRKRYTGFGGQGDQSDIGKPLWYIGAQLEDPRPEVLSIPVTRRMQIYLMILYRGTGNVDHEPKTHILANNLTGKNVVIQRRPRPIWRTSFEKMIKVMPRQIDRGFSMDFQRVVKLSRRGISSAVKAVAAGGGTQIIPL